MRGGGRQVVSWVVVVVVKIKRLAGLKVGGGHTAIRDLTAGGGCWELDLR